jgi:hypothetical protein
MSSQSGYVVEDNYIDRMLDSTRQPQPQMTQQELVVSTNNREAEPEDES